jgi:hypothetical protein
MPSPSARENSKTQAEMRKTPVTKYVLSMFPDELQGLFVLNNDKIGFFQCVFDSQSCRHVFQMLLVGGFFHKLKILMKKGDVRGACSAGSAMTP